MNFGLTSSAIAHLEGFKVMDSLGQLLHEHGPDSVPKLVNLQNTSDYCPRSSSSAFPRPLCSSTLYDLCQDRPVCLAEVWLAQGFPHSTISGVPTRLSKFFTSSALASGTASPLVTYEDEKVMVGNTMHFGMVALFFLYILATTDKSSMHDNYAE